MLVKIENIREELYRWIESEDLDSKKVLEVSQQLDELIVEYHKLEIKSKGK